MRTVRLLIEYDGTRYAGWQRQRAAPTVQQALEDALAAVTGQASRIVGAGRTDAGVHALGQVAHFVTGSAIPAAEFPPALGAHLPPDIVVLAASDAPPGFDARRSATARVYRYVILNRPRPSALVRSRAHHVASALGLGAMRDAAARLVGRRDFAPFHTAGSSPRTTVCDLRRVEVRRQGVFVIAEFEADRFLRHMVRLIMGTLVQIGLGRRPPSAVEDVLARRERSRPRLPALGLYLVGVRYGRDQG